MGSTTAARGEPTTVQQLKYNALVAYYVLGFTSEMVVGGWQDTRFAYECRQAWEAAGRPDGFRLLQAPGEGANAIEWFLDEKTVAVLDAQGVKWRSFLVGERAAPPANAIDV
jgi:hypothetical protein